MCNAGVAVTAPVELTPLADFEQVFRVNVFGVVATIQAFLPLVRRARGRVVITGSQGGRLGMPMLSAYCGSKHAVEAVADALRLEVHRFGVRVSLLEPGSIATSIWGKNLEKMDRLAEARDPEARERYRAETRAALRVAKLQARFAIPAEKAARHVLHAFTAARPKSRYVIGLDARVDLILNALIPTAIKDLGIRKATEWMARSG
jgi:NAD(P)-dependent dehydrogenase (short-subunit alcohol dehydrogenase family)